MPRFKILLYFPEQNCFAVSNEIYERYAFDSYYRVDATGLERQSLTTARSISAEKDYDYTWEIDLEAKVKSIKLNLNGVHVNCYTAGESGSSVILLHGAGVDSASISWSEIILPLSEKHRVFVPDLPGYGKSDRPDDV